MPILTKTSRKIINRSRRTKNHLNFTKQRMRLLKQSLTKKMCKLKFDPTFPIKVFRKLSPRKNLLKELEKAWRKFLMRV